MNVSNTGERRKEIPPHMIKKILPTRYAAGKIHWWFKIVAMSFFSLFFFVFGMRNLIRAYSLTNPFEFLMYFFSSTFTILIGITGGIYLFFKIYSLVKLHKTDPQS